MTGDPWAEFRMSAPKAGGAPTPSDPWAEFRGGQATPPPTVEGGGKTADNLSVALDVAKAAPTGLAKGAIGLAGLPGDIQEMGGSLIDRIMLGAGHKVMDWTGYGPQAGTPERERFDKMYLGIGSDSGLPGSGAIRKGVETVTGPMYEPKTIPGQYVQTVGEFAPAAAIGPGGLVRKAAETIIPAVASETAGQATKGTKAEPVARLVAAIMGNVGTAAVAARASAPERAIRTAAGNVTPQQLDAAQTIADTGRRIGVPLTGAEAVQQATNGATKLADVQRVVEGSPHGTALAEMMAARPGQIRTATNQALDTLAPQSVQPSALGPQVADAAQRSIANSPEGRALADRILGVGPRTTAAEAGLEIQNGLRGVYDRREGMRAALADSDYAAAREAPETIGIDRMVRVERPGDPVVTQPQYSRPQFGDGAPRPLDPPPTVEAQAGAGPESLARFIARNGGIRLDGEAAATDLHRFNVPGLGNVARAEGKSIDDFWRERLIEEGYFRPDVDGGMARDISSELLRKLQNEQRGVPSYPIGYERAGTATRAKPGQVQDEYRAALSEAESRLDTDLRRADIDPASLHPDMRSRVLGSLMRGEESDAVAAYERAAGALREPPAPYVRSTTVAEDIPAPRFGQANPTDVVSHIDDALRTAKGSVADALGAARGMLFTPGGRGQPAELDLTVAGLQNARAQIGTMINTAARGGDRPTAAALEQVQRRLDDALATVPEHAVANRNFAAASEPLRPFETPALSKIVERDEYGRQFVLAPERAAPTIEAGGPSAVRSFNDVAPPEARAGFENYLGTRLLDAATDARGTVSRDTLALGMRDRADVLDTVPGLRERLLGVRRADEALDPQRQAGIGRLSRTTTTEAAGDAVLPSKPQVGGERELVDTVMRAGREDPQATAQLVRQRLADQADSSLGRLVSGEAQGGGARYAKDIAGTSQQATNLDAVLGALPDSPAARQAFGDLLQTFRATGQRKPQGSATDFNAQYRAEIGAESLPQQGLAALRTGGRSLLTNAGDSVKRAILGRNNARLAEELAAADSVARLRAAIMRGAETPYVDALARLAVQAGASR